LKKEDNVTFISPVAKPSSISGKQEDNVDFILSKVITRELEGSFAINKKDKTVQILIRAAGFKPEDANETHVIISPDLPKNYVTILLKIKEPKFDVDFEVMNSLPIVKGVYVCKIPPKYSIKFPEKDELYTDKVICVSNGEVIINLSWQKLTDSDEE